MLRTYFFAGGEIGNGAAKFKYAIFSRLMAAGFLKKETRPGPKD
jgi:hypothetical protein